MPGQIILCTTVVFRRCTYCRKYLHAPLAFPTNHLQVCTTAMTTSSSYHRFPREEPVETTERRNRSSSAHNCQPVSVAGITGITGITAACHLPLVPLPLSQPVPGEILTTNGKTKTAVKAPCTSGENSPGLLSPQLAISKPIENISSGSKPRRFSPQLVESTRRTRKSGDSGPTILPYDKTDVSPGTHEPPFQSPKSSAGSALPLPPGNLSVVSTFDALAGAESRFSSSSLKKKEPRRHSFRIPELPSIQSTGEIEESNESNCPSASTSPFAASADNVSRQEATEHRKSVRQESEGYLLALAAQATKNKLREQAMAAYPNEKTHEPVDHFAIAREDGDVEDKAHAQRHSKAFKELEDQQQTLAISEMILPRASQELFQSHFGTAKDLSHVPGAPNVDTEVRMKDIQMLEMRNAASPPLAGQGLQYPLCQSPRQTRLDAGQIYQERKQTDSDLVTQRSCLWTPGGGTSRKRSTHGLWMGTSAKSVEDSRTMHGVAQTGLMTPAAEREEPIRFSRCQHNQLPPSPPGSHDDCKLCCVNSVLTGEKNILEEFHDGFITQVYNYLSLGYPSMARKFDAELSKISKVPIEELRQDDGNMNANGYVGAPERIGPGKEGACPRWGALREYVKEWARQQSHIGIEGINGNWGHLAKKGSWAI